MKKYVYVFGLILPIVSAFPQNGITPNNTTSSLLNYEQQSLDKYLWSYSHLRVKNDGKSLIDFNVIDNWQGLGDYLSLSNNGKYFSYTVDKGKGLNDSYKTIDTLVVQSTTNTWRQTFLGVNPGFFSGDSKQYIFEYKRILHFLQLEGGVTSYVNDVASFKFPDNDRNEWIGYQLQNATSDVVLQNLITGKKESFNGGSDFGFDKGVEWFFCKVDKKNNNDKTKELLLYHLPTGTKRWFSFVADCFVANGGRAMLIKTIENKENNTIISLQYVSLPEGKIKSIWSTSERNSNISNLNIDDLGENVVFCVENKCDTSDLAESTIWYYKKGMEKAKVKVTSETPGIHKGLQICGPISFTDNGSYIKFALQPKPSLGKNDLGTVQLDIWSFKDLYLQSTQEHLFKRLKTYAAIISLEKDQVIQIESEGETLHLLHGDFAVVKKPKSETYGDRFWQGGYGYNNDTNWLISLKDGHHYLLPTRCGRRSIWFSPKGNYLVYFDPSQGCHYFSYNLLTGKIKNISTTVPDGLLGSVPPYLRTSEKPEQPLGLAAWLTNDNGLLVYDNNDIWQLDLAGKKAPINITNGYGRTHKIIFSLNNSERFAGVIPSVRDRSYILLRAFNSVNKYNGFYGKTLHASGNPKMLSMGQYFMHYISWCHDPNLSNGGMRPLKATDTGVWIVQRQSAADAPNYYKTTNFKTFERLTSYQPQNKYNWLRQELHLFKCLDGTASQGILYKPENFDSSKRYPVLIIFYGAYSNNLYQFVNPSYNKDAITPGASPLWLLQNEYLIFTPDIYVAPLRYGPEAFNVIEGAAKYINRLPYVAKNKLACCAHSWSAKLGSYLLTHSRSFSAMIISEGFLYGNMINVAFSSDDNNEVNKLETVENEFKFGNFWENRDSWLDQTTVINADKAISPLLLLCNKESTKEYQDQTIQIFTAMRRLEKRVWWLKYNKGGHNLTNLNELKDFTIRYVQYLDHYLKDSPAPAWMTQGIPFRLKGKVYKYDLDPSGNCSVNCNICKKWNEQQKVRSEMFEKPIREWYLIEDINK